mmetsp:Transcript_33062/g.55347  ORF Transcript_33062/g.55347 Transcript_33062/m.55347 type:complete len:579 (+) Transcript_33062:245-1981(+)|eukprot:CAMPEP_0198205544 /NCGR_PEP_ID=MMETSP1445-20131203/9086_1 /TAXON_ID=36898 /ORGANISM="Pyramimonas sp., Strain CCMP2087" /LENGTH=578 /DNA_ID=CAMNT_0043877889 /DNA_START=157 /DNA_END=1893 /DNA_ORIENTATION=+
MWSSIGGAFSRKGGGSKPAVVPKHKVKRADLGEKNKFYYDEKLKRWVDPTAEATEEEDTTEQALPPPPSIPSFSDLASRSPSNPLSRPPSFQSALNGDSPLAGASDSCGSDLSTLSIGGPGGLPPPPPMSNMGLKKSGGLRARYVDVGFGKNPTSTGTSPTDPPPLPSPQVPAGWASANTHPPNISFFVPKPMPREEDPPAEDSKEAEELPDVSPDLSDQNQYQNQILADGFPSYNTAASNNAAHDNAEALPDDVPSYNTAAYNTVAYVNAGFPLTSDVPSYNNDNGFHSASSIASDPTPQQFTAMPALPTQWAAAPIANQRSILNPNVPDGHHASPNASPMKVDDLLSQVHRLSTSEGALQKECEELAAKVALLEARADLWQGRATLAESAAGAVVAAQHPELLHASPDPLKYASRIFTQAEVVPAHSRAVQVPGTRYWYQRVRTVARTPTDGSTDGRSSMDSDPKAMELLAAEALALWQEGFEAGRGEAEGEIKELEESMNDLLVCLGQEDSKVQRLRRAVIESGGDADALLADLIDEEDAQIDALVSSGGLHPKQDRSSDEEQDTTSVATSIDDM